MKIAGIILAGGLSTRMERDKATLILGKKTLLAHNVSLLSALNFNDVFVSGDHEGFQCIPDIHASLGPIGGLHACVEMLFNDFDALFVIPVDMPLLTSDECLYLLEKFKNFPQGVYYQKAIFPIILPITKQLKDYFSDVLSTRENRHRSLYQLFKTLNMHPIKYPIKNHFRFQNSNTPEQWADCLETYQTLRETKE